MAPSPRLHGLTAVTLLTITLLAHSVRPALAGRTDDMPSAAIPLGAQLLAAGVFAVAAAGKAAADYGSENNENNEGENGAENGAAKVARTSASSAPSVDDELDAVAMEEEAAEDVEEVEQPPITPVSSPFVPLSDHNMADRAEDELAAVEAQLDFRCGSKSDSVASTSTDGLYGSGDDEGPGESPALSTERTALQRAADNATARALLGDDARLQRGQRAGPGPGGESFLGRYKVETFLGKGSEGRVYGAYDVLRKESVALKLLKKPLVKPNADREWVVQARLRHDSVVALYDVYQIDSAIILALELCDQHDLFDPVYEARKRNVNLPKPTVQSYMQQIVEAVRYCHSKNVVHRDIKLENCVFGKQTTNERTGELQEGSLKITDFGLSRLLDDGVACQTANAGTLAYMAPEVIKRAAFGTASYDAKPCDVWSIGVVLFVLSTGHYPFGSGNPNARNQDTQKSCRTHILHNAFTRTGNQKFEGLEPPLKALIRGCLTEDPKNRLTLDDLRESKWLSDSAAAAATVSR